MTELELYRKELQDIANATPLPGPGGEREARLALQEWAKKALAKGAAMRAAQAAQR